MKTSAEKTSEKEVLWNKGVRKNVKIHERYLCVKNDAAFLKINSFKSIFEEI